MCLRVVACFLFLSVFPWQAARAVSFRFENITGNSAANAATGEAQLQLDVTDAGHGRVSFLFSNAGPRRSSITDVYFDAGSVLSSNWQIIDADQGRGGDPGVDFSRLATPANLPGANHVDPYFRTTAGLSADSDPPVQRNGVNPGEWLEIVFSLKSRQTFDEAIAALRSGRLRVGIHVQGFANGGSESFVNGPAVPEPNSALLSVIAIGFVGGALRRRGAG